MLPPYAWDDVWRISNNNTKNDAQHNRARAIARDNEWIEELKCGNSHQERNAQLNTYYMLRMDEYQYVRTLAAIFFIRANKLRYG